MHRYRSHALACAISFALFAGSAVAAPQESGGTSEADLKALLDKLSIVGLGETRQVQRLDATEAERYPAGTSLLKLLDRLPGVHFTNGDARGTYGWAKRISIRGFTQTQLGFTLDRVPLGDQSYGNHNGLHVSRALISENFSVLELSQGGGTLDTASTSNLGGTLRVTSDAPAYEARMRFDQTFGSDSDVRSFARLDTGDLRGWRAFFSALHQDGDKWKGWGPQRHHQFNGKLVREGETLTLSAFYNWSKRVETDYADLSLDSTQRLGYDWDNYAPDWQAAIRAAIELCGTTGTFQYTYRCDDAYYLGRGLRDDDLGYVTADWTISDTSGFVITAYNHRNEGQGHWATPYSVSATQPISLRTSEYDIDRWGVLPTFTQFLGDHKIQAGFWYEENTHDFNRNFYELNGPPDRAVFYVNPRTRDRGARTEVETLQYFIEDRINLMGGRMSIDIGFKGVDIDYDTRRLVNTNRFGEGQLKVKDRFIPKAAVRYSISNEMETFVAYGENISAYRAGISGPFATTQAGFNAIRDTLEPETSRTIEGGIRMVTSQLEGSLILYDVLFEDRLLAIQSGSGIAGNPSVLNNVGSVSTRGAEAAALWRISDSLEWYNSFAYNRSKYDDDYTTASGIVRTGGKTVVDSPKTLFSSNLTWRHGDFRLYIGAKHTGKRYITYLNDSEVDSFTVANLGAVYEITDLGWASGLKLQANITNLFDKEHHATVGSNPFPVSDPDGIVQQLIAGAPRQFFITASLNF